MIYICQVDTLLYILNHFFYTYFPTNMESILLYKSLKPKIVQSGD